MQPFSTPVKLVDCHRSTPGKFATELLIVEGDSASRAVQRMRDASFQAVLPMQGKPMNAVKASPQRVRKNQWFQALIDALGMNWDATSANGLRYDRVCLLFDPDADGIHCGALVLLFFDEYLAPLLNANRVTLIKPPLFSITASGYRDRLYAFSEEHLKKIEGALREKSIDYQHKRYRGLASLEDTTLLETCLDPASRTTHLLRPEDASSARRLFGGMP
ncbi:MAG: toprim domain-containing protein [Planctomycetota bacterium]